MIGGARRAAGNGGVLAARVKVVELPEATHFAHLDRAERGRDLLIRELLAFLAD